MRSWKFSGSKGNTPAAALVALGLAGIPFTAQAVPFYDASVTSNILIDHNTGSSPVSATGSGSTTQPPSPWNTSWQGSSHAGPGVQLGAYSGASLNLIGWYYGAPIVGQAAASASLSDIIISGPSATVSTSFNISVNGTLSATSGPLYPTNALDAYAIAYMSITYGGSFGSGAGSRQIYTNGIANGSVTTATNTGLFDSTFDGTGNLSSTNVQVQTGVPLSLTMTIQTSAVVGAVFGAQPVDLQAIADFTHTLTFAAGPVFNLPTGYTANSSDGQIVNNFWVTSTANPIPEPRSGVLLLSGLGCAMLLSCLRKRMVSTMA